MQRGNDLAVIGQYHIRWMWYVGVYKSDVNRIFQKIDEYRTKPHCTPHTTSYTTSKPCDKYTSIMGSKGLPDCGGNNNMAYWTVPMHDVGDFEQSVGVYIIRFLSQVFLIYLFMPRLFWRQHLRSSISNEGEGTTCLPSCYLITSLDIWWWCS